MSDDGFSYQEAGVNIHAGNELVERIKSISKKTRTPGVLSGLGSFGGLFELPIKQYTAPVLVSGTDGVGTKLKVAMMLNKHESIGIDLVAMCANDILAQGAKPLFFLDYYATGHLSVDLAEQVIKGIGEGCAQADIALIGGETAEMPSMYSGSDYDLAGFCVGIVDKPKLITGHKIKPGDQLIAIASSGIHANGYSLIRHLLNRKNIDLSTPFNHSTLGEVLLTPTKIYVKSILAVIEKMDILGIAHITGGGWIENIPRMLADNLQAHVFTPKIMPEIFQWLQQQGNIANAEMLTTFNCGVGMVLCVSPDQLQPSIDLLDSQGETAWHLGEVQERQHQTDPRIIMT